MVPLSNRTNTVGSATLSHICSAAASRLGATADRVCSGRSTVSRPGIGGVLRVLAVALTAAMVAACAQAPVVADKPSSFENNRRMTVATKKRAPAAGETSDKQAAETSGGSYGLASFYGHQSRTASGEKFNPQELTAAHRTLPFGTKVRVTDVATGRSVTVRVNDRGPFVPGRVVDISSSAAETLGISGRGVAKVKLDVVE
jgi:rare lipoprotein A